MEVINGVPIKVVLVGDATASTRGGWGAGFCAVMTRNVTCVDDALEGRSAKRFIDEGAWNKARSERGDYYLIQFGRDDRDPEGSFKDYLQRYISDVEAIGAVPVLVTPLSSRTIGDRKGTDDLKQYATATKEVGSKGLITVLDLNAMSSAMLNRMTQEDADKLYRHADPIAVKSASGASEHAITATSSDLGRQPTGVGRMQLSPNGQNVFGRMVADQLARTLVELGPDVIGEPQP